MPYQPPLSGNCEAGFGAVAPAASQDACLLFPIRAGVTPGALDGLLGGGRAIPSPESGLALGIPADTIRQRPDVRAAGHRWVAAVQRTHAAELEKLPSLNLSGSLGLSTLSGSKLFNPENASAGLVTGLTSPIFDAGRIRANIAAQSAVEEQALHDLLDSVPP